MNTPNFMRPELLQHPNLPKALHGVNPRTIKKAAWWKRTRKASIDENNNHCWSCGVHADKAMYRKGILEAHEAYNINWETGKVTLDEVVALCSTCHNFIHSGRLYARYQKQEIGRGYVMKVLNHGFRLLKKNGLKPNPNTALVYLLVRGYNEETARTILEEKDLLPDPVDIADWKEWRLILDGRAYYSKFEDYEAWEAHYA